MTSMKKMQSQSVLSTEEIDSQLRNLPGWSFVEHRFLEKEFRLLDFKSALDFVNEIGALAEQANHHPDIFLSWGKVSIRLSTHTPKGITEKDILFANAIETKDRSETKA